MRKNIVALVMALMMITTLWNPMKPIDNINDEQIIIMAVEDGPGGAW